MSDSYTSAALYGYGKFPKEDMACLRSLRRGGKKAKGGSLTSLALSTLGKMYVRLLGREAKGWYNEAKADKEEIRRLEELKKKHGGNALSRLAMRIRAIRQRSIMNSLRPVKNPLATKMTNGGMYPFMKPAKNPYASQRLNDALKRMNGGAVDWKTVGETARDIIGGPLGWIRLGTRVARRKKIEALKKEAMEKGWL